VGAIDWSAPGVIVKDDEAMRQVAAAGWIYVVSDEMRVANRRNNLAQSRRGNATVIRQKRR
jgi:hypothetical protein